VEYRITLLGVIGDLRVRHRAEAVEYRVEQHVAKLGDRLVRLRNGTTIDTTGLDSQPYRVNCLAVTSRA
jgi:hypothetical protein